MTKSHISKQTCCGVTNLESPISFYLEPAVPLQFPFRLPTPGVRELLSLHQAYPYLDSTT